MFLQSSVCLTPYILFHPLCRRTLRLACYSFQVHVFFCHCVYFFPKLRNCILLSGFVFGFIFLANSINTYWASCVRKNSSKVWMEVQSSSNCLNVLIMVLVDTRTQKELFLVMMFSLEWCCNQCLTQIETNSFCIAWEMHHPFRRWEFGISH